MALMNRERLKAAADALGRLEALEAALDSAKRAPHDAFPMSFYSFQEPGTVEHYSSDAGIKAYYPRSHYITTIEFLIAHEQSFLEDAGVKL